MFEKTLAKMSKIAIRITGGGDALIHLNDVHLFPRRAFGGQGAQHDPGSMTTADGEDKTVARGNSRACFSGNKFGGSLSDGFRIGQDFDLHESHFPFERR